MDLVLSACNPILVYMIFPVGPANLKKNAAEYVFIKQGKLKKIVRCQKYANLEANIPEKN